MIIYIQQNINFTSRNATIRRAEDIARRVNNVFPMQSNTKFKVMGDGWAKNLFAYEKLSEKSPKAWGCCLQRSMVVSNSIVMAVCVNVPTKSKS